MIPPPEQLLEALRGHRRFVLATHLHPDADALGSLLGLADVLESMGRQVFRFLEEPVSHLYAFMPFASLARWDVEAMRAFAAEDPDATALIALDCSDARRLGRHMEALLECNPVLVVDHHQPSSACFGDIAWIDSSRSSTGEMVADLVEALEARMGLDAAFCLYTAIVGDTGSFRYESTSPHTFAVASRLVDMGVRPEVVAERLFDNYSSRRLLLLREVLATLEFHHGERIAVIHARPEMFQRTQTEPGDTEDFINVVRRVRSVEVAVFLKEHEDGLVSASLRSREGCDVARVAALFGGGGHRRAAGFKQEDSTVEALRARLLPELVRAMEGRG